MRPSCNAVRSLLGARFSVVTAVDSAAAADAALARHRFDVLVCDIAMPSEGG